MDKGQLAELIKSLDSEVEIKEGKQFTEINVPAPNLYALGKKLKENQETSFRFSVLSYRSGLWTGSGCCVSYPFNKV